MQYINLDQQGFYKPFEALRAARDTGLGLYKDFREGGNLDAQKAQTQQQQNVAATGTAAYGASTATAAALPGATGTPSPAAPAQPGAGPDGVAGTSDDKVVGRAYAPPGQVGALDNTDVGRQATPHTGSPFFKNPATGQPYDWNNAHQEAWQAISPNRALATYGGGNTKEALTRAAKAGGGYVQGPNGPQWIPYGDVGPNHNTGVEMTPAAYHAMGSTPGAGHKFVGATVPPAAAGPAPGSVATDTPPKGQPVPSLPPINAPGTVAPPMPLGPATKPNLAAVPPMPLGPAQRGVDQTQLTPLTDNRPFSPMTSGPRTAQRPPVAGDPSTNYGDKGGQPSAPVSPEAAAGQGLASTAAAVSQTALPPVSAPEATVAPDGGPIRKAVAAPAAAQPPQAPPVTPQALTAATGVPATAPSGQPNFWNTLPPKQQQQIVQQHAQAAYDMAIASGANPRQANAARAAATPQLTAQKWDAVVGQTQNATRLPQVQDANGQPALVISGEATGPTGNKVSTIGPAFNQAHPQYALEQAKAAEGFQKSADADMQTTLEKSPAASAYIGNATRPGLAQVNNEMIALMGGKTIDQAGSLSPQQKAQIVFRYEKTNDAGAIVRPEMFRTIAERAGLYDKFKTHIEGALKTGNNIPTSVVKDLISTVKLQTDAGHAEFLKQMKAYDPVHRQKWGAYGGVDKSGIIPQEDKDVIAGRAPAPGAAPAAAATPSFDTPAAAQAAIKRLGLKTGDKITIGGRTATVN